jgi:Helix-hairpin-helix domain
MIGSAPLPPAAALRRIAFLLERAREPTYKVRAFRRAAAAVEAVEPAELARIASGGGAGLRALPGVGGWDGAWVLDATPATAEELIRPAWRLGCWPRSTASLPWHNPPGKSGPSWPRAGRWSTRPSIRQHPGRPRRPGGPGPGDRTARGRGRVDDRDWSAGPAPRRHRRAYEHARRMYQAMAAVASVPVAEAGRAQANARR